MQEQQSSIHIGIMQREPRKTQKKRYPSVWIGLMLLAVPAFWWFCTAGWGWMVMHFSDPRMFGPTHGNTITAVIGGGDSRAHPTTLTAMNTGGLVEIKIIRSDKAKPETLRLLNLSTSGFPNPTEANIELEDAGDHIQMTVLSTVWDTPFHRVVGIGTLVSDGEGHLTFQQG
jgi:hypothetical protein